MEKKKSKLVKALIIILTVILSIVVLIGVLTGAEYLKAKSNAKRYVLTTATFEEKGTADRIHFLNTGHSDAFLIESNGKFAMVDAGEDTEFPADMPHLDLQGYEQEVLSYLKEHASNAEGKVVLEFVLGTHAHSDHIGGFDTIINDEDVIVNKAYLREYHDEYTMKVDRWDNQIIYQQMVDALNKKDIEIITDIPKEPFAFEDFTCQFVYKEKESPEAVINENANSIGLKLTKGEKTAYLASDMEYFGGVEKHVKKTIGKVDLLKVGHHGYTGSTSLNFIRELDPDIAIITNKTRKRLTPDVGINLTLVANASTYVTGLEDGIMATFTDDNQIVLNNHLYKR